jgi:hypothetical protein
MTPRGIDFRVWTPDEDARLVALSRAGHTATAIAEIVGNRSVGACRDRLQRLQAGPGRGSRTGGKAKARDEVRLRQLVQTIEAAAAERRPDEALIAEYRGGILAILAARYGVRRGMTQEIGVPSLRSQHSASQGH